EFMLQIKTWVLGPVATNTYLVGDPETKKAVVIDPAWDGNQLAEEIKKEGWQIQNIWLTHAHFDHFGGLADLLTALDLEKQAGFFVGLHPEDLPLWKVKGGAVMFGISLKPAPNPEHEFKEGEILQLGTNNFVVHHTPGHSAGHVIFHCPEENLLFSGDLIFKQGIGRTDLLGGSYSTLMESINTWVLPLPEETRIFSGHGPETTVGAEKESNPFL
ncbi:MAG: MBL fold metallo-hydrolase, partial [Chloroflexi bacterium]|nr:MBL fold metallo-hydrolase [Chloroflexota bacterium]